MEKKKNTGLIIGSLLILISGIFFLVGYDKEKFKQNWEQLKEKFKKTKAKLAKSEDA